MGQADIAQYEGLVAKTAQMFSAMVGVELDDLRQELRIKIIKSQRSYNPARSRMTERAYVYSCMANFVKDLKRNAARRSVMRVGYIEDHKARAALAPEALGETFQVDAFEYAHLNASHDQVYGDVEDGTFVLPSTVTEIEAQVLALLGLDFTQAEIAACLRIERAAVAKHVRSLRDKFADWKPSSEPAREPVAA